MSRPSDEFIASIGELSNLLLLERSVEDSLQRVSNMAAELVPSADGVGVTLIDPLTDEDATRMRTAAYSAEWVMAVDNQQYRTNEGPCMSAIREGRTVRLDNVATDDRYKTFSPRAERHGLSSVLAVPLSLKDRTLGSMNFYSRSTSAFDERSEEMAKSFAGHASVALVNVDLLSTARVLSEQLSHAMESRAIIEQAKGMLMARLRCSDEEAFLALKKMSQDRNVKLRDLAAEMVAKKGGDPD